MQLSVLVLLTLLCNCRRFTTCMRVENVVNINAVFLDIHKHNESNFAHPSCITESRTGVPYHHISAQALALFWWQLYSLMLRPWEAQPQHSERGSCSSSDCRIFQLFYCWLVFQAQLHVSTWQCHLLPSSSVSNLRAISYTRVTVTISLLQYCNFKTVAIL